MIADLKPYPEYKESGLPWLGHVPGHWGALPVKQAFDIQLAQFFQGRCCFRAHLILQSHPPDAFILHANEEQTEASGFLQIDGFHEITADPLVT